MCRLLARKSSYLTTPPSLSRSPAPLSAGIAPAPKIGETELHAGMLQDQTLPGFLNRRFFSGSLCGSLLFGVRPLCDLPVPQWQIPISARKRCPGGFCGGSYGRACRAHFIRQPACSTAKTLHVAKELAFQVLRQCLELRPRHGPGNVVAFHFSIFLPSLLRGQVVAWQRTPAALSADMRKRASRSALFLHAIVVKIIHTG